MGRPPTVSSLSGRDFQAEEATYLSARGVWTVDRLPNGGDFQACEGARGGVLMHWCLPCRRGGRWTLRSFLGRLMVHRMLTSHVLSCAA